MRGNGLVITLPLGAQENLADRRALEAVTLNASIALGWGLSCSPQSQAPSAPHSLCLADLCLFHLPMAGILHIPPPTSGLGVWGCGRLSCLGADQDPALKFLWGPSVHKDDVRPSINHQTIFNRLKGLNSGHLLLCSPVLGAPLSE